MDSSVQRTFIAVKPDGVQRGLVGQIIARIERKGFKLVGLKMIQPTTEQAETHYAEHKGKPFFSGLGKHILFISSQVPYLWPYCWYGC